MTQPHVAPNNRPGQMTSTMRAMPQVTGPKVLRIGMVQGGKVIDERVIKQRITVTVGPSEKSQFVIAARDVPANFKLFELVGDDYVLNFLEGMKGRVALKTGVSELSALRGQARQVKQGSVTAFQVPLSEDSRGKVVIEDTTFLFQFVAPPPVQPKPQLPVSVKSGLSSEIDWTTTIIAAFSFLFHFGAVGSIYSDWMDAPVLDDAVQVQQLLDSVKQLPAPPVEVPKETTDETPAATATAAAPSEAPKPSTKPSAGTGKPAAGDTGKSGGSISDARAAALVDQLDSFNIATIGALSSKGSATESVLGPGSDLAVGLLDKQGAAGAGAGQGGVAGLNMGSGSTTGVRPGSAGSGLASIGNTGSAGPATAGSATAVKGPVGNASIGGASVAGGNVPNASSVVSGMAAGFRRCYNRGLAENPEMKGSVRITAKIGPNGEVVSATPSSGGNLSGTVISCVAARVRSAQFAPPEGGGATIVIPVSFTSQ